MAVTASRCRSATQTRGPRTSSRRAARRCAAAGTQRPLLAAAGDPARPLVGFRRWNGEPRWLAQGLQSPVAPGLIKVQWARQGLGSAMTHPLPADQHDELLHLAQALDGIAGALHEGHVVPRTD